jgi:glycosyltransferase involved in cell wall biosynthesis
MMRSSRSLLEEEGGIGGQVVPTVALLAAGDRFEDFHDKIGVSFETFRTKLTGGWLFNYVEALQSAGVRTVLIFASARVDAPVRFIHSPTGVTVWILPSPRLHRKVRSASERWAPRLDVLASLSSYLATPVRLLVRTLRSESCDAILCHEYEYARFDVSTLVGRILGLPVFATFQGADHTVSWLETPIRWLSLRRSSGLIIGASVEIRRVRRVYHVPSDKIANIPNPIDVAGWLSQDRSRVRKELAIPQDARVVEWHGHVQIRRKGLDVLLDAWELVCAKRPDALLILVGTGRNTAELRERVTSNPRIKWIDRYVLDREELWRYLAAADVYTLPSRHEGFAVAPLEAMASGLPIVAADAPGIADLLSGGQEAGGLIVPREDPSALAAALLRLLDDDALARELGARGRRRAEQEYSLEIVGRRLHGVLFPGQASSDGA